MWLFFLKKSMKKAYRVKKNEDFTKIIHQRQSVANKDFVLYYMKNESHLRAGISVSKKLGHAVVRNKIKRQVRMTVHEVFDHEYACDYVIIVRKHYLTQDYATNKQSLLSLYEKTKKRMGK